jgi:4'-phosphopantetheinyl transferase
MDVYWLEQNEANVPAENDWLSQGEAIRLNGMNFGKRRTDWRLGRWTAKRALAACLNLPDHREVLARIEIRSAPSGAPEVYILNKPAPVAISLSHCDGAAVCAVAPEGVELGCDLEMIEPGRDAFLTDYFTVEEQALIARACAADRPQLFALLWSAKESALKALGTGLRLDPRCVIVSPVEAPGRSHEDAWLEDPTPTFQPSNGLNKWRRLQVRHISGEVFHGWWRDDGNLLRTTVADPPPDQPILLEIPIFCHKAPSFPVLSTA